MFHFHRCLWAPVLASFLFALCTLAQAQPALLPSQLTPDNTFGVNIHTNTPSAADLDLMQAAGVHAVRNDFGWGAIEKTKGVYDFSGPEALLKAVTPRGMRVIFILDYGNSLYTPQWNSGPADDASRAAYAHFAAASVAHFRGQPILWEVWNEPNIDQFWEPKLNAAGYAQMAQTAIAAMRIADPKAFIVGPALATFNWDYLDVLAKSGVLAQFDAITVHPYRRKSPETAIADFARLRKLIDQCSPTRHIPILAGEWGYSTAWPNADISDHQQAEYAVRQRLGDIAAGVPLSVWYDWRDDGIDPKEPEHHFGLLDHAGSAKPAYRAVKALHEALGGYEFVRELKSGDNDHALLFQHGRKQIVAMWTTSAPHIVPLFFGALPETTTLEKLDLWGGNTELQVNNNLSANVDASHWVEVPVSESPSYVLLPPGVVMDMDY